MTGLFKAVLSAALLVLGSIFIYGFGAGYFSSFGLWLPSPWNFLATFVLAVALLLGVVLIWTGPLRVVRKTS